MVKKHKFYLSFVLAVLLIIPCMVLFAGCGNNTLNNLTNTEMGVTVDGGKFEKGSELSVEKYENTSTAGQEALTRIASYSYKTTLDPIIYDIKVTKDDATVQPNGAITITMNAPYESTNGFVVFHIVDESTIETPEVTYANGKISFSVTHFSVFIVAEDEESGELSVHYDDAQGTVKFENGSVMPKDYTVTLKGVANIKLTAEAKNGYKFVGWYKGIGADAECITDNATASFTRFNTSVHARFEENNESTFMFKLELELKEENDDVVKSVEYYTTGNYDGKSTITYDVKVNGETANCLDYQWPNNKSVKIYDYGDIQLNSSTAYNIINKGTLNNYDGIFKGKITINSNYKLFRLQELESSDRFSLISVSDKMQELTEGQYIVVRTEVYESVKNLNNENGDMYETVKNLMPHDGNEGEIVNANSTAAYVFSIQFDIASIKNA